MRDAYSTDRWTDAALAHRPGVGRIVREPHGPRELGGVHAEAEGEEGPAVSARLGRVAAELEEALAARAVVLPVGEGRHDDLPRQRQPAERRDQIAQAREQLRAAVGLVVRQIGGRAHADDGDADAQRLGEGHHADRGGGRER
ncbi:MAG: hypothetical protein IPJ34_43695 [Myxococcales bacterium]|nr:hypothetical protein [Myxococcales bacterium]